MISFGCTVISFNVVFLVRPADRSGWSYVGRDGLLAKLLGQSDDDPLGAADETEPVALLVLRHLADEFGAVRAQAGDRGVDVIDGEHDATDAQRVRRCVLRLTPDRRRRVELRQLDPPVAVRGPHHDDVGTDAVEPDDTVNPTSLDGCLALQLHTKFGKERGSGLKIVDDDEDVVHPPNRHGGSPSSSRGPSWPLVSPGRSQGHILDTRHDNYPRPPSAAGRRRAARPGRALGRARDDGRFQPGATDSYLLRDRKSVG